MEEKQEIKVSKEKSFSKTKKQLSKLDNAVTKTQWRRIIIVDDDKEDREIFISALDSLNLDAEIFQFCNGVDLMAYLFDSSSQLPNIIFLDLNMPLMNGEECLSDIRGDSRFNNISVIIYSGYYDNFMMEMLKKNGADHYFLKPNNLEDLERLIEESLALLAKKKKLSKDLIFK